MKKCQRCNYTYPLSHFPSFPVAYDGFNSYCVDCFNEVVMGEIEDTFLKRVIDKLTSAIIFPKTFKLSDRQRESSRISSLRYLARKRQAEGTFSAQDIQDILTRQDWKCLYCGEDLHEGYHVDHVVALVKGGSNWPNNLACACPSCNTSKRDRDVVEWLSRG